jgi:hypothetical protein
MGTRLPSRISCFVLMLPPTDLHLPAVHGDGTPARASCDARRSAQ